MENEERKTENKGEGVLIDMVTMEIEKKVKEDKFSIDGFVTLEELENSDHTMLRCNEEDSDFMKSDLSAALKKRREEHKKAYKKLFTKR